MKKKEKQSGYSIGSEKLSFASGTLGGFMQKAQSASVNFESIDPVLKDLNKFKMRVPVGKAGMALAIGAAGLGAASVVQSFRETDSFGDAALKIFFTNPLASGAGRMTGRGAGFLAIKSADKLKKVSSAYAAKRASAKVKDVTPNSVVFRRIGGRIIPIRKK